MARLTPRITPYVPKPRNISPSHLLRSAPRAIITGNVPHPPISGVVPKLNSAPAKAVKPKLVQLTQGSSTGRPRKANPKPKTPGQLSGISISRRTRNKVSAPKSQAAQRPGIPSLQGTKMKVRRANPIKVPSLKI